SRQPVENQSLRQAESKSRGLREIERAAVGGSPAPLISGQQGALPGQDQLGDGAAIGDRGVRSLPAGWTDGMGCVAHDQGPGCSVARGMAPGTPDALEILGEFSLPQEMGRARVL